VPEDSCPGKFCAGPHLLLKPVLTGLAQTKGHEAMTNAVIGFERPLTEQEVGELLSISVNTLKHWRWVGKGPRYVQIGRKIGYRPADLREWIDDSVTEPGGAA